MMSSTMSQCSDFETAPQARVVLRKVIWLRYLVQRCQRH
jgi:hypothetical protein